MTPGGEWTVTIAGLLAGGTGVVIGGIVLARAGDVIAARTGVGGLWFGLVFLALATSLPEFVTAGAAIRIGAPDLAAGDLFGSNMANMLILALSAIAYRAKRRFSMLEPSSALIVLTYLAAIAILAGGTRPVM